MLCHIFPLGGAVDPFCGWCWMFPCLWLTWVIGSSIKQAAHVNLRQIFSLVFDLQPLTYTLDKSKMVFVVTFAGWGCTMDDCNH